MHPHVFRSALQRQAAVIEYQVRQTVNGAEILIRASGELDSPALERRIEDELAALGVSEPRVTTRVVQEIPRLATGKVSRFVALGPS